MRGTAGWSGAVLFGRGVFDGSHCWSSRLRPSVRRVERTGNSGQVDGFGNVLHVSL